MKIINFLTIKFNAQIVYLRILKLKWNRINKMWTQILKMQKIC